MENHRYCHHGESTPLPTRVVNVGSDTTEPYLCTTRRENANYTTLSHCWGGKMPMTTTLATFEQRKHEIRFSELPKTFKDAITITRKLNVQYLWIDSLCIIQDSEQDWTAEAAKMGSVYRNCVVCIAADGAPDSNGGCFIQGAIHRNLDIACVKCLGLDVSHCAVHIREMPEVMAGYGFAHVRHTSKSYESELDTRGWVLQEQALSPRTLHYTGAELAWDCSQWSQCECTVRPKETGGNSCSEQLRACKSMVQLSKGPLDPDGSVGSRWANLVELFTARSLTYNNDRLHALSGIAADISQSRKNDTFLAGLWRAEIPLGLLWRTKSNPHTRMTVISRRYQEYYAPSWSWASVTGPTEFIALPGRKYNFKLVPDLTIVDAACEPVGTNPYGPVRTGGYLRVRGLLAPITLLGAGVEEPAVESYSSADSWARTVAHICSSFDADVLDAGEIELIDGEPLWLLLVAHGERCSPGLSRIEGHHCIVLRTSRLKPESTFERVGCTWALKKEYWADELAKRAEWRNLTLL
jgi:Heterokaryon incompatibility protein (HET)